MKKYITIIAFAFLLNSCKDKFLDAKPSTEILQPIKLEEFERLLDHVESINSGPALGILGSDEYVFSTDAIWASARTATERNSYIWAQDLFEGETSMDWNQPYIGIFYANSVLKGIENLKVTNLTQNAINRLKGWALFIRAYAYYDLVNNFAPTYDEKTASTDLGVPIKLESSIDKLLPRATSKETYTQIFNDLTLATKLLDAEMPFARTRPSKAAAHALSARIYLNMRKYDKAELHADSCLNLYNKLLDYNTLSKTSTNPFKYNHDEQIYAKQAVPLASGSSTGANVYVQMSTELISLYEANDLRLQIFFNKQPDGSYDVKRSYFSSFGNPFVGLATDEIYLIKAECAARRGDIITAMERLNQLKITRWNPNGSVPPKSYQIVTATNSGDALNKVLLERRKELVWRNSRWEDIKRLNMEGANITLKRVVNGQTYTLTPNSPKFIFPIPNQEINLSGIIPNVR